MYTLILLPGILMIVIPIIALICSSAKRERKRREWEAAQASEAERRRIEAERKRAIQERKAAEREAARAIREAEQQRKRDAKMEDARQRAEYAERELAAKREARALERGEIIPTEAKQVAKPAPKFRGNNAFVGQVVAFTGKLPGMTRAEAIQAVQDNGGRAYTKMPTGTTLLVVGDKPGMCKLDKADEWIGQVRKITPAQFFAMLNQPLTLELDEFAAMFAAQFAA